MKLRIVFISVVLITIISCTKTEAVSGIYRGTACGYSCGVNVEATIIVTCVDDNLVDIECDFHGLMKYFTNAKVFKGNDKYFISHSSGMKAAIRGFDMHFEYEDKMHPNKSISFFGTK